MRSLAIVLCITVFAGAVVLATNSADPDTPTLIIGLVLLGVGVIGLLVLGAVKVWRWVHEPWSESTTPDDGSDYTERPYGYHYYCSRYGPW